MSVHSYRLCFQDHKSKPVADPIRFETGSLTMAHLVASTIFSAYHRHMDTLYHVATLEYRPVEDEPWRYVDFATMDHKGVLWSEKK